MKNNLNFLQRLALLTIYLSILSVVPALSQLIQFPALSRGQSNCDEVNISSSFCRVKRFPTVVNL